MDEDDAAGSEGLVDEVAGVRHPYEQVLVIEVLHGDPNVTDARLGMLGGDGVGADGDDVGDPALGQRARRLSRDEAGSGRRCESARRGREGTSTGE